MSAALIAGHLGWLHPAFDSVSHFRMHLAVLAVMLAAVSVISGGRTVAFLILLIAAGSVAATYWQGSKRAQPGRIEADAETYRLLQFNVHPRNRSLDEVIDLIADTDPDILVLQEVAGLVGEKATQLRKTHPHSIVCGSGVPDVAIFSRHAFEAGSEACHESSLAVATMRLGGRSLDVGSIHITWPWPRRQASHIRALSRDLSKIGPTAILAGDLNAVPWSHAAGEVMRHAGMTRTEPLGPTWIFRRLASRHDTCGIADRQRHEQGQRRRAQRPQVDLYRF